MQRMNFNTVSTVFISNVEDNRKIFLNNSKNYFYSSLLPYVPYHTESKLLARFNKRKSFVASETLVFKISARMELYR